MEKPIEQMNVSVSVPKATHELADAIADFAITAVKEIKDNGGYSSADDLPAIGVALMGMLPRFSEASKLGADVKVDPAGFATAWALAGRKLAEGLMSHA